MFCFKEMIAKKPKNEGLTLVEVQIVLVILGILAAIAVANVIGLIENAKEDVCEVNRLELERMYLMHVGLESKVHSTIVFEEYFLNYGSEVCPSGGVISYEDGAVKCSIHSDSHEENDNLDEGNEGVPFL